MILNDYEIEQATRASSAGSANATGILNAHYECLLGRKIAEAKAKPVANPKKAKK